MEAEIRTIIGIIIFALLLSLAGCYEALLLSLAGYYEKEEYLRTLEVNNE